MNVYSITDGNITSSLFDLIEATDATQLLSHTPATRIMGIDKSRNDLYYFDGISWELMSGGEISGTAPDTVTGLYIEVGSEMVQLTWDVAALANYYKVFQVTSGTETLAGITSATSISVTGLSNGNLYGYRVVSTNNFGDAISSVTVQGTPYANVPGIPTGVSATNIGTTSATISWLQTNQALSYIVYLTPQGGSEVVAASPVGLTTNLLNLVSNTQYSLQVAAVGLGGEGFLSSAVQFTTLVDIPDSVNTINVTKSDSKNIINWSPTARATTYKIFSGTTSASLSELIETSATSYEHTGLTNGTEYFYNVVATNSTGLAIPSVIVSGIPEVSTFSIYLEKETVISYSGMMKNEQPDEGIIPPEGRTYVTTITPLKRVNTVPGAYFDYVDVTFANLSDLSATGMKILLTKLNTGGITAAATATGVVTQDVSTGWLSAAIDIPPAVDGITTKTVRIPLPSGTFLGDKDIAIRLFVPETQATTYARTFSSSGATSYENQSMYSSFSYMSFQYLNLQLDWKWGLGYANGNYTNPANVSPLSAWVFNSAGFDSYLSPKPSSSPWMSVKWHMVGDTIPNIKTYELVGDSIAQGYGDRYILSTMGIAHRVNLQNKAISATNWIVNYGQSGFTPEQYLARWEGIAKSTSATAMIYSIFSPNGYFDGGIPIVSRIEDMKNNCLLAEQKAEQYGRLFIPCFITNTNLYQLNTTPASAASQNTTWMVKELYDWAHSTYGNRLLDLQPAVLDTTNTIGINMASEYTGDATHPNVLGIDALGAKMVEDLDTVYQNVVNAL